MSDGVAIDYDVEYGARPLGPQGILMPSDEPTFKEDPKTRRVIEEPKLVSFVRNNGRESTAYGVETPRAFGYTFDQLRCANNSTHCNFQSSDATMRTLKPRMICSPNGLPSDYTCIVCKGDIHKCELWNREYSPDNEIQYNRWVKAGSPKTGFPPADLKRANKHSQLLLRSSASVRPCQELPFYAIYDTVLAQRSCDETELYSRERIAALTAMEWMKAPIEGRVVCRQVKCLQTARVAVVNVDTGVVSGKDTSDSAGHNDKARRECLEYKIKVEICRIVQLFNCGALTEAEFYEVMKYDMLRSHWMKQREGQLRVWGEFVKLLTVPPSLKPSFFHEDDVHKAIEYDAMLDQMLFKLIDQISERSLRHRLDAADAKVFHHHLNEDFKDLGNAQNDAVAPLYVKAYDDMCRSIGEQKDSNGYPTLVLPDDRVSQYNIATVEDAMKKHYQGVGKTKMNIPFACREVATNEHGAMRSVGGAKNRHSMAAMGSEAFHSVGPHLYGLSYKKTSCGDHEMNRTRRIITRWEMTMQRCNKSPLLANLVVQTGVAGHGHPQTYRSYSELEIFHPPFKPVSNPIYAGGDEFLCVKSAGVLARPRGIADLQVRTTKAPETPWKASPPSTALSAEIPELLKQLQVSLSDVDAGSLDVPDDLRAFVSDLKLGAEHVMTAPTVMGRLEKDVPRLLKFASQDHSAQATMKECVGIIFKLSASISNALHAAEEEKGTKSQDWRAEADKLFFAARNRAYLGAKSKGKTEEEAEADATRALESMRAGIPQLRRKFIQDLRDEMDKNEGNDVEAATKRVEGAKRRLDEYRATPAKERIGMVRKADALRTQANAVETEKIKKGAVVAKYKEMRREMENFENDRASAVYDPKFIDMLRAKYTIGSRRVRPRTA